MTISLLTYNLLFNKAFTNVASLLKEHKPELVCFQEMETNERHFKELEPLGYELADFSNSFIKHGTVYGIATFYRKDMLKFVSSRTLTLPRSYYEILLLLLRGGNNPRTVLRTEFTFKDSKKSLSLYNLHLSPYATNGIRVKQLIQTLQDIASDEKKHLLIAGDFNYPYGRKTFETIIAEEHLKEATNNLFFTLEQTFLKLFSVKLKLDYILYRDMELIKTEKIPLRYSDHYPILSTFTVPTA